MSSIEFAEAWMSLYRNCSFAAPLFGKHYYFFKLYALENTLNLPAGASKKQVEQAIKNHIIAELAEGIS
ncbi:986_t:CDS:2 [Ambispora gerdemannii]|uniref:986_t:CDS:1 n=1 Tax=Ambispora gerdemannii TaxID=144530 RepID=A0A9N9ATL3_9GLOM|nr:986_t:CDS:2 [Ambispora gerdemannii]